MSDLNDKNKNGLTGPEGEQDIIDTNQGELEAEALEIEEHDQEMEPDNFSTEEESLDETDAEEAGEDFWKELSDKKTKVKKKSRKFKFGALSSVMTVVVVVAIILVNVVVNMIYAKFPLDLDLSPDKIFTISKETTNYAKSLSKDVEVTLFTEERSFGGDAFDIYQEFYKILKSYENNSKKGFKINHLDPTDPVQMAGFKNDNITAESIVFSCEGRKSVTNLANLYVEETDQSGNTIGITSVAEREVMTNLVKVLNENPVTITMITGHGEDTSVMSSIASVLTANGYFFTSLNTTSEAEFDAASNFAIIAGAETDFTSEEIEKLRKWLNNDGKLNRNLMVLPKFGGKCENLYEFLKVEYGIEIFADDLTFETDVNRMRLLSSTTAQTGYVYVSDFANTDFEGLAGSQNVLTPYSLRLKTTVEDNEDNSYLNKVLTTVPNTAKLISYSALEDYLNKIQAGEEAEAPQPFDADEYPIITSAFSSKRTFDDDNNHLKTNVLVTGSTYFFASEVLNYSGSKNEEMLVEMANYMTGQEIEVVVSVKELDASYFEITPKQQSVLRIAFKYVVPALFLVLGIFAFVWRKRL